MRDETGHFGHRLPYRFTTDDEAIKMANDTEFGLAAYFYSRDIGRIWRVAEALEYGIVGINEDIISSEIASFGGMKGKRQRRHLARHWSSKYGVGELLEVMAASTGSLTAMMGYPKSLSGDADASPSRTLG